MPDEKLNQDGTISEQWLAEEIARREGKTEEVNIAQIKEILKNTLDILQELRSESDEMAGKFDELMERHSS